ncbi:unnamed protein product [Microthlaspi erraticum]|uniref:Uncharacterized protein n=1 Tax=Microthlaspi erraticum TaxID=1685480 RepID=A0A6D2KG94_9BRAS|nr:unnamed protein product [Microthlaspi erraticum]
MKWYIQGLVFGYLSAPQRTGRQGRGLEMVDGHQDTPLDWVFWSILEHMGHKEHGGTWHMEAAQLDTQRKKGEAILKTSSTVTRPTGRVPQLDRPSFNSIELGSQSQTRKMLLPP